MKAKLIREPGPSYTLEDQDGKVLLAKVTHQGMVEYLMTEEQLSLDEAEEALVGLSDSNETEVLLPDDKFLGEQEGAFEISLECDVDEDGLAKTMKQTTQKMSMYDFFTAMGVTPDQQEQLTTRLKEGLLIHAFTVVTITTQGYPSFEYEREDLPLSVKQVDDQAEISIAGDEPLDSISNIDEEWKEDVRTYGEGEREESTGGVKVLNESVTEQYTAAGGQGIGGEQGLRGGQAPNEPALVISVDQADSTAFENTLRGEGIPHQVIPTKGKNVEFKFTSVEDYDKANNLLTQSRSEEGSVGLAEETISGAWRIPIKFVNSKIADRFYKGLHNVGGDVSRTPLGSTIFVFFSKRITPGRLTRLSTAALAM